MKTDKVVKKLGAGAKIIPNVGLFPTVFGLFFANLEQLTFVKRHFLP
jgi:hypothetical protein